MNEHKKSWFTLIEVIIVMTAFFVIVGSILTLYTQMLRIQYETQARQSLIQDSYFVVERINTLMSDYSIDYEEYYNRSQVGCTTAGSSGRDVGIQGHCSLPTYYGNKNSISVNDADKNILYYCTSATSEQNQAGLPRVCSNPTLLGQWQGCNDKGCDGKAPNNASWEGYGEYALQFRDVGQDVDTNPDIVGDADDKDLGMGPDAINNSGLQELYLISSDHTKRTFLRRALLDSGDRNHDGTIGSGRDTEYLYGLQILKLKGFDAGEAHDFDTNTSGVYDGKIDTRACDYGEGFLCHGDAVDPIVYTGYRLPDDSSPTAATNDGRANALPQDMTVSKRNLEVYPTTDPDLARNQSGMQISPYVTLRMQVKLYGGKRQAKLGDAIETYEFTVQTTFSTKGVYTK